MHTKTKKPTYVISVRLYTWYFKWEEIVENSLNVKEICVVLDEDKELVSDDLVSLPLHLPLVKIFFLKHITRFRRHHF